MVSDSGGERLPNDPEAERLRTGSERDESTDRAADLPNERAGEGPPDPNAESSPHRILNELHRTHGNAFVQRLIQRAGPLDRAMQSVEGFAGHVAAGAGGIKGHIPGTADWPKVTAAAMTATASAMATWKSTAVLTGVIVNGVTAMGGTLVGPPLMPTILAGMSGAPPQVALAFASAATMAWTQWAATVKVPGLPWYPSFAAVPSPVAPPTPNVPSPLIMLGGTPVMAQVVGAMIRAMLPPTDEPGQEDAITQFTTWFQGAFEGMRVGTLVTNVLGTGPVPTFAPPYVPVGPVVGGVANGIPGSLVGGGVGNISTSPAKRGEESGAK